MNAVEDSLMSQVTCYGKIEHSNETRSYTALASSQLLRKMSSSAISSELAMRPVGPRYAYRLSGQVWPEVVFMEDLQPKSHGPVHFDKLIDFNFKKIIKMNSLLDEN